MNSSDRRLHDIEKLLLEDEGNTSDNKQASINIVITDITVINQIFEQAKIDRKSTKKTSPLVDKVLRICQESIKWRGKSPSPS